MSRGNNRVPSPGPFRLVFTVINRQRTEIDQMKPNLDQARSICSSLLDPADGTPVSSSIWAAKSIPRSAGIAQPESQVFVQTQNAWSRAVRLTLMPGAAQDHIWASVREIRSTI